MRTKRLWSIAITICFLCSTYVPAAAYDGVGASEPSENGNTDSRVVYAQDFNDCTWWEGGSEPTAEEFERTPFYKAMDDGEKMQSAYKIEDAANGRAAGDKSLHINQTFTHEFGKDKSGNNLSAMTEDNMWVGNGSGSQGTNGVSHRITLDSAEKQGAERYLHISFSTAQSYKPSTWIDGEQGSGLDVSFVFNTSKGETEKEMLHWYNDNNQGIFGKFLTVLIKEEKWINYDYILDTQDMTGDVYVNGCLAAEKIDLTKGFNDDFTGATINGITKLNFQVRDTNLWGGLRDTNVYLDDIKVEYAEEQPTVSTYSVFGEAARISAPEKYVDNETGIIYNYGQTLSEMSGYLAGKNVYLVKERANSTPSWPTLEEYDSQSLDAVTLDDGRTVSPILFAENGKFTYRYTIKQPQATALRAEISSSADGFKLSWTGNAANCRGIEVFRNSERIAVLAADVQSYTDADAEPEKAYDYTIRELLPDKNVSEFTDSISNADKPKNLSAVQVPNKPAVSLTWDAPSNKLNGDATGYKIYRDGIELTEVGAAVLTYTDDSADIDTDTTYRYSVAAVYGRLVSGATPEVSVYVSFDGLDSRVVYTQDFNACTWWEGGSEPTAAEFERTPFYKAMDDGEKMQSTYKIKDAANGRTAGDKSLHINQKFTHEFGSDDMGSTTEDGIWVADNSGIGTNGVSHRITLNSGKRKSYERYMHVSFSAAQSYKPSTWIEGEQGSGLDVSFAFNTSKGETEKEMLHWYNNNNQGIFGKFFTVLIKENKWISYDYVFDTEAMTEDVYVNGFRVAENIDISDKFDGAAINGIGKLNFQVRDTNRWGDNRNMDVYLDDIKVEYGKEEPTVSTYSVFGAAAHINAPEKYVNKETGVIYNYGQTLSEMSGYLTGKNVYLVKETTNSTPSWPLLEEYDSQSLDAVELDDGREVSPILFAEDGSFTYRYIIKQPRKSGVSLEVSEVEPNAIVLGWSGKSADCRGIEVFKDGVRTAVLPADAQSYRDTDVILRQSYEYCIRELFDNGDVGTFSSSVSSFVGAVGRPESFAAALIPNRLIVKLTWEKPSYGAVNGYKVYRNGAVLAALDADVYEYTDDSDLTVGKEYCYSVAAVGADGEMSDKTTEVSLVPDVISPPLNPKIENVDPDIKLSWDSVEGAKAYDVYRNGVYVAQTSECSYVFDDCTEDSFYEFYVKTVNALDAASRASETVRYIKHNSRMDIYSNIFDDKTDRNYSLTATDSAVIEQGKDYCAIGENGIRIGFNSQSFNEQSAGFAVNDGLDLSKIKNSAAEIRFLMYVPEGLDISKLGFAAVRDYNSNFAGKTVSLKAAVALDRYVKNSGWNFVRIPLKDLPNKGVFTAKKANIPYEADFNYSKVKGLVFTGKVEGMAENTYFMADEIAIYADRAPEVISVKANGGALSNDAVISGRTNRFSVKFDTEMDTKQLSSDKLKVVCGNKMIPSVVEYDSENDEYVISLLDKLEPNKDYSLVVEKAVSKIGTTQKGKYTVTFKTDSDVSAETVEKTVIMNLKSMSGTTDAAIKQEISFDGGAANETLCGFEIEISYDAVSLLLDKDEVKIISDLKNSGVKAQNKNGKLIITCAADKTKEISIKDGIGTFAIKALKSGSSRISAAGKLYRYYSDTDTVKEFGINGSATITAAKGSSGSGGSGSSGGGSGSTGSSSAIGGARPSKGSGGQNTTPAAKTVFDDISSVAWAREGILYLSEKNIINGYEDNTFRPNNAITREEFVAIIVRAFEVDGESVGCDFSDVDKSAWYYKFVSSAVNTGIINGIDDNMFGTGEFLSRQDMCTILRRVIENRGLEFDKQYSRLEFADENEIADYAKEAVSELQQIGIVNGVGENMFAPEENVTRAMAAKAIYQMMQGRDN